MLFGSKTKHEEKMGGIENSTFNKTLTLHKQKLKNRDVYLCHQEDNKIKNRKSGGNKNVKFIQQYCIRIRNCSRRCGSKWFTDIFLVKKRKIF